MFPAPDKHQEAWRRGKPFGSAGAISSGPGANFAGLGRSQHAKAPSGSGARKLSLKNRESGGVGTPAHHSGEIRYGVVSRALISGEAFTQGLAAGASGDIRSNISQRSTGLVRGD